MRKCIRSTFLNYLACKRGIGGMEGGWVLYAFKPLALPKKHAVMGHEK
jgi:hypothetical protein